MVVLTYKDEDGTQEMSFDSRKECDAFIAHNEDRVGRFFDEKFEVISINDYNERSEI